MTMGKTFIQLAQDWQQRISLGQAPDYVKELEQHCRDTEKALFDDEVHDFVSRDVLGVKFEPNGYDRV
jgi:hypothetical protein